jgi:hypothetical protein
MSTSRLVCKSILSQQNLCCSIYSQEEILTSTPLMVSFLLFDIIMTSNPCQFNEDRAIRKCIKWINAPDPSVNFNAAYERITKGTGMWFMQNSKLSDWKANGDLLWLQGKGKIVLIGLLLRNQNF